ncbi:MAG: exosortase system-associated protein, TIGR04073 family [Candidatus Omnitrophica bacterium]|nr:exosortase system-associated protein, TIGR04073 family [Candidatus Omnitrophota bacterium]
MKKLIILLLIGVMLFSATAAYADLAAKKLYRGVTNIVTSPLEILNGIQDGYEKDGILGAITWGPLGGIFKFGGRVLCGVFETVTFPFPEYGPIIKNPEFLLGNKK